jgi:hypothetical protein
MHQGADSMTHLSFELAGRIRDVIKQWLLRRMHECVHCCQCEGAVTPWDSFCPICGQRNPARLSSSAAVYLVLGFVMLAIVVPALILAF